MVRSAFRKFMGTFPNNKEALCIEVGVAKGLNAAHMLMAMPNMRLFLVDKYRPYNSESGNETQQGFHDQCKHDMGNTLKPFRDRIRFIEQSSLDASKTFEDETFDFVYIDAEHTYDMVKQDVQVWRPKVKKGGIFAGHDYNLKGVFNAVREEIDEFDHDIFDIKDNRSDWWIVK